MATNKDKLEDILHIKEDIKRELLNKGFSEAEVTDAFGNYPLLINSMMNGKTFPKWFTDALVCWYEPKKQGLTNSQIEKGKPFLLKDFSKNHLDMTMHGFDGEGMSGMDGWGEDFSRPTAYPNTEQAIIYSSDEKNVHFKGYGEGAGIWYNAVKKSAYKVNITGIKDGQLLFYKYFDGTYLKTVSEIQNNGIQMLPEIPSDARLVYFLGNVDVTIEQLPLYEGALCFDGVDDYGVSNNMPIFTKEKGYTVIAKRRWTSNGDTSRIFSFKGNNRDVGAFILESWYTTKDGKETWTFGGRSFTGVDYPNEITYQTSYSYNGRTINLGKDPDSSFLYIGGIESGYRFSGCVYQYLLFDRDLTLDEISWVKHNIMGEPLPKPIAMWSAKGRSNDDPTGYKEILPDLTGNGHNIQLHNFAYSGDSGYGGLGIDFKNLTAFHPENTIVGNFLNITNISKPSISYSLPPTTSIDFKIKVVGIDNNVGDRFELLIYGESLGYANSFKIRENGIYNVKLSFDTDLRVFIYPTGGSSAFDGLITVELLPKYPDALVFDGVDDFGECDNMPLMPNGFTAIAVRSYISDKDGLLIDKYEGGVSFGEFAFEDSFVGLTAQKRIKINRVYNNINKVLDFKTDKISFLTSKSYNGVPQKAGNAAPTKMIRIAVDGTFSRYANVAFYELHIFDHDLTPTEIELYIKRNIDPNYTLPVAEPTTEVKQLN